MPRDRRVDIIAGLRAMADFFEAHPTVPVPYSVQADVFVDTKEDMAVIARASGWTKEYRETWFSLEKFFAPDDAVRLEVNIERDKVCRRVVTGKKWVPTTPGHEIEEVEWVCDEGSLLGAEGR